jgi:hypothetical protein
MPDHRRHRGPHPQDVQLFANEVIAKMRTATGDLAWLLTKGYSANAALKLVGDRYSLVARQRIAVARCACSDQQQARRRRHEVNFESIIGQDLTIDGFNVLTSIEAAMAGGVVLQARDGCYRDMASMHGSYRQVHETRFAAQLLGRLLVEWKVSRCCWLLDQPVSNSGRLATMLRRMAEQQGWAWQVELVYDPDSLLIGQKNVVATADSGIIDRACRWFNLARHAIETLDTDIRLVDLSCEP